MFNPNTAADFSHANFPAATCEPALLPLVGVDPTIAERQTKPQPETQPQLAKVLHVINGEHFSGAERVQQLLGMRMHEFGFATEFACIKPVEFATYCGLEASRVHAFPMRSRFDLGIVSRIEEKVQDEQFELLHAHTPRSALITSLVSRRTGIPWVYHVHSPTARDSTRPLINRVNQAIERYALRNCDMVVTVSKSLRREMLKSGMDRSRLRVVPNGVAACQPIDAASRRHERQWRLGLVALMRPRKGVEVALGAIHKLKAAGLPVSLELIGEFETETYRAQTLRLLESMKLEDVVTWSGFTDDVSSALRRLDALVLPSLFGEGMPMVVLEALAAAVPIIATRVEGIPEVIRDGVEGYLAEPGDTASLTQKILQLTSDRPAWQEMSARAFARHAQSFSDTKMAARVARAYQAILVSHK